MAETFDFRGAIEFIGIMGGIIAVIYGMLILLLNKFDKLNNGNLATA